MQGSEWARSAGRTRARTMRGPGESHSDVIEAPGRRFASRVAEQLGLQCGVEDRFVKSTLSAAGSLANPKETTKDLIVSPPPTFSPPSAIAHTSREKCAPPSAGRRAERRAASRVPLRRTGPPAFRPRQ